MAGGFMRSDVEERLVALFNTLPGFTPTRDDDLFMAVPAENWTTKQLPNRRIVLVGVPDGAFEREGMQAGSGPGADVWTIPVGIVCTAVREPIPAKKACEAVLNTIADEFARDHRLGMAGPQETSVVAYDGPWFATDADKVPTAWINFDISCTVRIERNPS